MLHYVWPRCLPRPNQPVHARRGGRIVRETKIDTDPDVIAAYLGQTALTVERVGLEAGPLSQWLHAGLVAHGLPTICVETRHTKAARAPCRSRPTAGTHAA